jgi:hypothetical protein
MGEYLRPGLAGNALKIGNNACGAGNSLKIGNKSRGQDITKGWVCGVAGEDNDWLDHRLGPTPKMCGGACNSDVQQGFDLLWVQVTTSADCKKVS